MGGATLTRFYGLHFLLPFVIAALAILHLSFLAGRPRFRGWFLKGWSTLISSPHGEVRKWYPLLVRGRQAENFGEFSVPPPAPEGLREGLNKVVAMVEPQASRIKSIGCALTAISMMYETTSCYNKP